MALGVVAVFLSLPEAQVARGALRSAGISAVLFDELLGSNMWTYQVAFGGFRLAVPDTELASATAILQEIDSRPLRRRDLGDRGLWWRWLAAIVGLGFPEAGWFIVGLRRRRPGLPTVLAGAALSGLLVVLIVLGLTALELLVFDLAHPP